jgi:hypothetical protein
MSRDEAYRAGLRSEAQAMRQLWACVAMAVIQDACADVHKARLKQQPERADMAIRRFCNWLRGPHGRLVLQLAGIDAHDRAQEALLARVSRGEIAVQKVHKAGAK